MIWRREACDRIVRSVLEPSASPHASTGMMTESDKRELAKRALQHQEAGRLLEAAAVYHQILAADPDDARILSALGILSRQRGRNDLAIGFAGRAVQVNPSSAI